MADVEYAELWLKQHYDPEDGSYTVVERPITGRDGSDEISFQWSVGPITIKGTINTKTYAMRVTISVHIPILGNVTLLNISGDLQKGIEGSINVYVAKGSVRFYLKNGKEVWVELKLSSPFFRTLDGNWKIFTICE